MILDVEDDSVLVRFIFRPVMISGVGGAAMAGSIFPFLALIGLTGLEVLVAVLQAYVFTILTCMYLNDALHLH